MINTANQQQNANIDGAGGNQQTAGGANQQMEESKNLANNSNVAAMGDNSRYVTLHDEFKSLLDAGASDEEENDDDADNPKNAARNGGEEAAGVGNGADN